MIEASLRELLTSGVFGPITAATTASEAVALLPDPDSVYDTSTGSILTFGTIELHVLGSSRCFLYAEHDPPMGFSAGPHIHLDPWFFCTEQAITLGLVAEKLSKAGIGYTIEQPNLTLDMVLDSGVTLHFENIDDTPNLPDTKHHFIAFSYPLNQGPTPDWLERTIFRMACDVDPHDLLNVEVTVPVYGECNFEDLLNLRAQQACNDASVWLRTGSRDDFRALIRSVYFGVLRDCVQGFVHSGSLAQSASTATLFMALALGDEEAIGLVTANILHSFDDDDKMLSDYGGQALTTTMPLAVSLAHGYFSHPMHPAYSAAAHGWDGELIDDIFAGIVEFRLTDSHGFRFEKLDLDVWWEIIAITAMRARAGLTPPNFHLPELRRYSIVFPEISVPDPKLEHLRATVFRALR